MALLFSEMISRLSADERKLLDNTFAKHPDLAAEWTTLKDDGLRQADYSRNMNELKTEREKHATDLEWSEKMKTWWEDAEPTWKGLQDAGLVDADGKETWTQMKSKLEADLAEAQKAAIGGDMKPEELDRRVREIVQAAGGTATKEEIKALYEAEGKKMAQGVFDENWTAKEKDFNENTIPKVSGFSTGNAIVAMHWEKETGKPWGEEEQKQLFELMVKEQIFNPFQIEEKFLAPIKAAKTREAQIEAEVQKRLNARRGMPGGGGGTDYVPPADEPLGALQTALAASAGGENFEDKIKAQSVKAAQAMQAEGKF